MSGGFVICEYDSVKQGFPQYQRTMQSLKAAIIEKATRDWSPKTYGRMSPTSAQFGTSTIMPELFRSMSTGTASSATLTTWNQWLDTTGSQTIMSGSNSGVIYEDYKIGLAGLAFLDKSINIAEIRMQISDRKTGRINIEEAFAYEQPAVIFEDGFILDEETGFDLYAYVLSTGYQKIKLLGIEANRVPNKLQVSNTGAALT